MHVFAHTFVLRPTPVHSHIDSLGFGSVKEWCFEANYATWPSMVTLNHVLIWRYTFSFLNPLFVQHSWRTS